MHEEDEFIYRSNRSSKDQSKNQNNTKCQHSSPQSSNNQANSTAVSEIKYFNQDQDVKSLDLTIIKVKSLKMDHKNQQSIDQSAQHNQSNSYFKQQDDCSKINIQEKVVKGNKQETPSQNIKNYTKGMQKKFIKTNQSSSSPQSSVRKLFFQESSVTKIYDFQVEDVKSEYEESSSSEEQPKQELKAKSLFELVKIPVSNKNMIKCVIKIEESWTSLRIRYFLYLPQDNKILLTAQRRKVQLYSRFQININSKKQNNPLIAICQSNFARTEYVVREKQIKIFPNKKESIKSEDFLKKQLYKKYMHENERQLIYMEFEQNLFGLKVRSLKMIKGKIKHFHKQQYFSNLKKQYQGNRIEATNIFTSKRPVKTNEGKYELKFSSKNIVKSKRNTILEDQQGNNSLLLAKASDNHYNLEIYYPFCLIEGFSFALACLDSKPFA